MASGTKPMARNQKVPQVHVQFTPEERVRLERFCKEKGHTITWTVREGLRLLYAEQSFG